MFPLSNGLNIRAKRSTLLNIHKILKTVFPNTLNELIFCSNSQISKIGKGRSLSKPEFETEKSIFLKGCKKKRNVFKVGEFEFT